MAEAKNEYNYLKVYFDGGSRGNPGPAAVGAVIYDENDKKIDEVSLCIGKQTNNIAEYMALDKVLDALEGFRCGKVVLFTDSKLLHHQIKKIWKIKDSSILKIYLSVNKKLSRYGLVDLRLIPREMNREADRLVNLALDGKETSYEGESEIKFGSIEDPDSTGK